jgi:uncharacterized protein (DUF58 family)
LSEIDWGTLAPLRLRARSVAEGIYAGAHRSQRRGAGVEFGGHRPYVPGDDLRWLDRRALLRHDRLIVREFETETDRGLRLVVDASRSMVYRSPRAQGAKLAYAAVLGAALARIATASGDPVGLDWIGGDHVRPLPAMSGREAFDRVVGVLESAKPGGDLTDDLGPVDLAFGAVARHARRGTIIVLLSDLIDLPPAALDRFAALAIGGRMLIAVQVLDPDEASFPFSGTVRLRALEGGSIVEADADAARASYLDALDGLSRTWSERLAGHGGAFLRATTDRPAGEIVRAIVAAAASRPQSYGLPTLAEPTERSP